jgi:hypothetical protein
MLESGARAECFDKLDTGPELMVFFFIPGQVK